MAREPKSRAKPSKTSAVALDRVPTAGEIDKLYGWAATTLYASTATWEDKRAAALVLVLFGTGARRFECAAFRCKDIFDGPDGPVVVFRTAKGGRSGVLVPITAETARHVQGWLATKRNVTHESVEPEAPLFCGENGEFMALPTIWRAWGHALKAVGMLHTTGKKNGLPKYGMHASRHAGAFLVLRATKSYADLKRFLRHASIKTTEKFYEHFDLSDVRKAMEKAGL